MSQVKLKERIVKQFNLLIDDETNYDMLNGFFDSLVGSGSSNAGVSEEHYKKVAERREEYLKKMIAPCLGTRLKLI